MRKQVAKKIRRLASRVNLDSIDYPPKVKDKWRWVYRQLKREYNQDKRILSQPHLMDYDDVVIASKS